MAHHSSLPFGGLVLRRGNGGLTTRVGFLGAIVLLFVAEFLPAAVSGSDGIQFFENQIRPIFVEHCYSCHSASAAKVKGGLKLDTREDFLRGGTDGPVVAPGDPAKSPLVLRVRGVDKEHRMPPAKEGVDPLPRMAIDHLVRWVEMGAPYPATPASLLARETSRRPWSWDPPRANPAPTLQHPEWARTSIDPFLLSPLEKVGLQPVAPATRLTWIRRVTFDLTGLPPTPEEIKAFELDSTNDAYERVVDRLLASPRYGEQWGRHWLDVVRYADTAGDTADYPVGLAWKYRNYVIQSFNQDKPYPELSLIHI